ncbi:MAG: YARHG domain-containing protein, partial [Lachnospiraceae bacterium]|nr:YARHG domain-containing protein [Lachnospiraceae bacterium]
PRRPRSSFFKCFCFPRFVYSLVSRLRHSFITGSTGTTGSSTGSTGTTGSTAGSTGTSSNTTGSSGSTGTDTTDNSGSTSSDTTDTSGSSSSSDTADDGWIAVDTDDNITIWTYTGSGSTGGSSGSTSSGSSSNGTSGSSGSTSSGSSSNGTSSSSGSTSSGSSSSGTSSSSGSTSSGSSGTSAGSSSTAATDSSTIIEGISSRYISESELYGYDLSQLRLIRNEIFALNGRMFVSEDLQEYFSKKTWYVPIYTPEEFDADLFSHLNEYEKANLNLILAYEESLGG